MNQSISNMYLLNFCVDPLKSKNVLVMYVCTVNSQSTDPFPHSYILICKCAWLKPHRKTTNPSWLKLLFKAIAPSATLNLAYNSVLPYWAWHTVSSASRRGHWGFQHTGKPRQERSHCCSQFNQWFHKLLQEPFLRGDFGIPYLIQSNHPN